MPDFPSSTSASGIWQMRQVKRAVQGGNWPLIAVPDPYFEYVSLLLPGDGTNGAQNNTFLDSSTNNFTITRNGNTTQGTFSPYGSNWSNYFDGSGDYLSVPGSSAFAYGTGSFTIEFWIFGLIANDRMIYDARNGGGTGPQHFTTGGYGGSLIGALRYVGSSEIISTAIISDNTWHHCAIVRNGSSAITLYVDGVASGSGTDTTNYTATSGNNLICRNSYGAGGEFNGYLSNFRIIKGVALYTSNFTPSTTPLTAIANTSLLTCQSNRFIDNSSNNFTITRNGDVSVQRFSPFNPTTPYAAGTIGGSGYFDGTGDFLNTPSTGQFAPAGDFTISCWYYPTSTRAYQQIIGNYNGSASTVWIFEITSGTGINFYTNGTTPRISGSGLVVNAWNYLVLARSGSTITGYVNGVSVGTYSQSGTFGSATQAISIGRGGSTTGSGDFGLGYIADVKLIDGSAVTTVPTAPQTATSGTSLLCSFTNGGIIDNAMMNDLETVGNAQISTSVSKFGGGSVALDGNGDYLSCKVNDTKLSFGTANFTVEAWLYITAFVNGANSVVSGVGPTSGDWMLAVRSATEVSWGQNYISWDATTSGITLSTNTWYHVAVCRSGTTLRIFVNGTSYFSGTNTVAYNIQNGNFAVGARQSSSGVVSYGEFFNGNIDDLRITKGFARYTSNFSVPTAPFPTL